MKVLIDTNIILDVLCSRKEFVKDSTLIFKLCETKQVSGYVSALSIPNIVYIMRKELDEKKIKDIVNTLSIIFTIADLKKEDINKTVNIGFSDFEDGLQATCAKRIKASYIITRNISDFSNSKVKAISPSDFLSIISKK